MELGDGVFQFLRDFAVTGGGRKRETATFPAEQPSRRTVFVLRYARAWLASLGSRTIVSA